MGMRSQIGVGEEATYGTRVAPTRFYEFVSESLERRNRPIQSNAIRAGGRSLRRGARRAIAGYDGGGEVQLEVGPDGFGLLFAHALGTVSTDSSDAPDAYAHTFTLGDALGKSLTVQKGVERADGTVVPFDFVGCKVATWRLGVQVDGFALLDVTFDARDVKTDQTLATPTYVDGSLWHFGSAGLTLGGAPVASARSSEIVADNVWRTDRYYLGQAGLKAEPVPNGYPTITGTMEADFVSRESMYDAYAADAPMELTFELVGAELAPGVNERLTVTVPEVRLTGGTPTVDGPTVPTVTVPWEGFYDGSSPSVSVVLVNGDATP